MGSESEARMVIFECATDKGFYAGNHYKQYWTRDLAYSIDVLLDMKLTSLVRAHLLNIIDRQKPSGEVPTVIQTLEGYLKQVIATPSIIANSVNYSGLFAVKSFLPFTGGYHDWTGDSTVMFLLAVKRFEEETQESELSNDGRLAKAMNFVETSKIGEMVRGSGWYDSMHNSFGQFTFFNNVLFAVFNKESGKYNFDYLENFWDSEKRYYVDYLGSNHFDTLAHALAIGYGFIPEERVVGILQFIKKYVFTVWGFVDLYPPYSFQECKIQPNMYQNGTIWEFIEYRLVKVFLQYDMVDCAKTILNLMYERKGFSEWYSPIDGSPHGSTNQLWSACAYLGTKSMFRRYKNGKKYKYCL